MNWIPEKSIVNTCKLSTLGVDFFTASLLRIPGNIVLSVLRFCRVELAVRDDIRREQLLTRSVLMVPPPTQDTTVVATTTWGWDQKWTLSGTDSKSARGSS